MADGNAPRLIDDGVYLDLPLWQYIADPALSGSAFKLLLVDPPAWRWERPDNELWERRPESRPQLRGSAAHCAILEGLAAYEARYCIEPKREDHADALDTIDDLKNWLRGTDAKITGRKDELQERILEVCGERGIEPPQFWPDLHERLVAGRTCITTADDAYVRMLERFVSRDGALSALIADGVPEVSIFWTEDGVRFKARLDSLSPRGVVDLKTFGQPPKRGWSLLQHLKAEVAANGYDIQAVHNVRALRAARQRLIEDPVDGFYVRTRPGAGDAFDRSQRALDLIREAPSVFTWLFLRMGSGPTGAALPFPEHSNRWAHASEEIAMALDHFRRFSAAYGPDDLWMRSEGVLEFDDGKFPIWSWDQAH